MFAIDDPSAVAVMPTPEAAGTAGWWTEGNPALGQAATLMRASWFNGLQQELLNILSAGGVTPNKTTYNQLLAALNALYSKGRLLRTLVYTRVSGVQNVSVNGGTPTTTGAGSYVPGASMTFCIAEVQGAGNAGGGASVPTSGNLSMGSPGGCGAYGEGYFSAASIGASQVVTVGLGGAGVASAAGGNGGASSLGSLLTAPGGIGSAPLNNFVAANIANGNSSVTAAPTGANLIAVPGMNSSVSLIINVGATTGYIPAPGAPSKYGQGGAGAFNTSAGASTVPGTGGGGVICNSAGANSAGGKGGDGQIIIREFA
ncbi:hypothetical protein ACQ858_08540 [Variovorax ureilyticus]|uniref:hypothetical protein n=1 Tax=Variovorax ureilyticus TaxID=1836198 RepID=UPI003D66E1DD